MFKDQLQKLDHATLLSALTATGKPQAKLFELAKTIKTEVFGQQVWFRGIVEFSNVCKNNCYYCGIRRDNQKVERYQMSIEEIKSCLEFIDQANYGSVVYQGGELSTEEFKKYLLDIVELTHVNYPEMGITISAGELDYEFLKKLRQAGANRYLLRIETSSQALYKKLHPQEMSWQHRFETLKNLQQLDYQVGTGVMVGLPGQTLEDLIGDLKFFNENQFHMYGLGPYVIHKDTPLGQDKKVQQWWVENKAKNFSLFLNFVAILRILQPKANIAAATACDVFDPLGRIKVLEIAGNVIMPSVTPKTYRKKYLLYQDKPCLDEDADQCLGCLSAKIIKAGLEPVFGEQGTAPLYIQQTYGQA